MGIIEFHNFGRVIATAPTRSPITVIRISQRGSNAANRDSGLINIARGGSRRLSGRFHFFPLITTIVPPLVFVRRLIIRKAARMGERLFVAKNGTALFSSRFAAAERMPRPRYGCITGASVTLARYVTARKTETRGGAERKWQNAPRNIIFKTFHSFFLCATRARIACACRHTSARARNRRQIASARLERPRLNRDIERFRVM